MPLFSNPIPTKEDIGTIRHVYLDLDEGGPEAVKRLLERSDIPKPNCILENSPEKYQVIRRVEGFTQDHAESMQRALVRETGADPAATDSSRILRIPGFYNHKYETPRQVTVERLSDEIYRPDNFPEFTPEQLSPISGERQLPDGHRSQSEKDWAYAMRALSRGDPEEKIIAAIAKYRSDKPNPHLCRTHRQKGSRRFPPTNPLPHRPNPGRTRALTGCGHPTTQHRPKSWSASEQCLSSLSLTVQA